ncbi:FdhF/YdeP family oxidoreductase [Pseudomonas sp. RTB3]|nr:FdhF/YdeP family oxidoreductase [Pseudomonas sp. RTB3]
MSIRHQADKTPTPRYKPYRGAAGGWGALVSVTQAWLSSDNALKNLRMMLKTNQNGGFDCPGCAWGDSPESGIVKFCENGAKAVNWEATKRRVDASFFARYSVSALREQSDYWLEYQGRLTEPMSYNAETDRYTPISWDDAFALIGKHLRNLPSPNMAEFYTSGRASNEAAYLYQLFVRAYGTNNFPDCSNMCHEASGVALAQSVGVGKGTVTFDDFEHADAIFVLGQNPGTNHPRMLEPLREAVKRGAQVVCVNPLKERGLERFQHPQHPLEMLTNGDKPTNTAYFRPALGGDMAILRGMAKFLLLWERQAQAEGKEAVFDHDFLNEHTANVLDYLATVDDTSWEEIIEQSGLPLADIEHAAKMYCKGQKVIMCWAMGITQHRHSVPTIQEIANLMLLRGNIGKPGAGLCPVRGHSNVQGDRTMGINERPPALFLDALEKRFQFKAPRASGHNVVEAIHSMLAGKSRVFIGLGGNFAQATPDSTRTVEALNNCDLTVQISTKLNRSHLTHGAHALILPCFGRTDIDIQSEGPQAVTVEDSFSMVHGVQWPTAAPVEADEIGASNHRRHRRRHSGQQAGGLELAGGRLRAHSRPDRRHHPRLQGLQRTHQAPRRFLPRQLGRRASLEHPAGPRQLPCEHSAQGPDPRTHPRHGPGADLIMQSMRSHDQYNTTIYGLDDRYRGVKGQRDVLFVNEADIIRLGFKPGQKADLVSIWDDGRERRVKGFTLLAFDIPAGQAAAYYPEVNPLVPLESVGDGSHTPTSKFIAIRLETASDDGLIMARTA